MLKKILYIIGGVALLALGYSLGGGNPDRRRVGRTQPDFDGIGRSHDTAESGIDNAGEIVESVREQLADSQERVDRLIDSSGRSQALIARGREILARANARDGGHSHT